MADDLRSRIETLIASTPYVIGKDCYMVKVSDLKAAIAAAPVPSPPAQPKAWECVCTHHYRAHDRNTFRCTEGGCECSGYVDGPATFYLAQPSPPAPLEVIVNGQLVVVTAGTVRAAIYMCVRHPTGSTGEDV